MNLSATGGGNPVGGSRGRAPSVRLRECFGISVGSLWDFSVVLTGPLGRRPWPDPATCEGAGEFASHSVEASGSGHHLRRPRFRPRRRRWDPAPARPAADGRRRRVAATRSRRGAVTVPISCRCWAGHFHRERYDGWFAPCGPGLVSWDHSSGLWRLRFRQRPRRVKARETTA